ncbi:hypothetical protein PO909_030069, partial [Leuciscus waleckii]
SVDHGGEIWITAGLHKCTSTHHTHTHTHTHTHAGIFGESSLLMICSDSHQLTLDLDTVSKDLRLSEENRVITGTYPKQPYPDHPDRFDLCPQVLCRESVCGRCYWEIEWSGISVFISVSYKSISRKGLGHECWFGYNDQSWSLECSPSRYTFWHNDRGTDIPVEPISSRRTGVCRVEVCVDHSAGTLSFYSVSDTLTLIHTVQTTFTHTLYPGFRVDPGASVKLC